MSYNLLDLLEEVNIEATEEPYSSDESFSTNEALKIKNKKFKYNGTMNQEMQYELIYKNTNDHNFTDRVQDRTDLTPGKVQTLISIGIDYILKRVKSGKIKDNIAIGLKYKKSKVKIIFIVNPWLKYIKVATILDNDMKITNAVKWTINERFVDILNEVIKENKLNNSKKDG